jgi:hypothetical protein
MLSRFWTVVGLVSALVAGMLLTPRAAVAQDQGQTYYTYVSLWAVPRAQWAAFDKQEDLSTPVLQKLVADGTIVDWGNTATRVHQEDGYTHAEWFTAASRDALLKALEIQWSTATNSAFVGTTKHYDLFLRTIAHGGKTSSGATGYLRVAFYQAKPGDEEAFAGLFSKGIKPMLDAAVADGTLTMYNFDVEEIHTGAPGAYNLAMMFPNGAAMDKFYTDLMSTMKDNPSLGQLVDSVTIGKDHRDSLSRVTAYEHK